MPPDAPPPFDAMELVWIWDPDAERVVWASEAAVAFWGERRLADLQARPFLPSDPNTQAMGALLSQVEDQRETAPLETTQTFFPDGAPVRLRCAALARRRRGAAEGKIWLAIHASPPELAENAAEASPAQLLLETAETAFALTTAQGAPMFLNAAARRLFGASATGDQAPSLFSSHLDPERARRAATAALMRGAFAHTADLIAQDGERRRALILYRRALDPITGEALLSIEASLRPRRTPAFELELEEGRGDDRLGIGRFDLAGLRLREANAALASMLGPEATRRGTRLAEIFPEKAEALTEAIDALRGGAPIQALDLPLGDGSGRGPWGAARLSNAQGPGEPSVLLSLLDLGPERRRLLLLEQERSATEAALAGLGVGLLTLGPDGALRRADALAAEALGLTGDALDDAIESELPLTALLSSPSDERLAQRLTALFAEDENGVTGAAIEQPIEAVLARARPVRLSLSAPYAFGRREISVAIDLAERIAAPHEMAELATALEGSGALDRKSVQRASHGFRTALTTIKGFAELARDDAAHPVSARQRRRMNDIVETAASLAEMVERVFDQAPSEAGSAGAASTVETDLAMIAEDAAKRCAARHPVWSPSAGTVVYAAANRDDLDEALDILLAEAADRGPTRLNASVITQGTQITASIEIDVAAEQPSRWPPLALRASGLLVERAGGALQIDPAPDGGVARLRVLFSASTQP